VTTLTASVGYQPAGMDLRGRRCREAYHAIVSGAPVRIGFVTRNRGAALCGAAPLGDCPPVLFAVVSCPYCIAIAAREHVMIGGPL
jgi:hypothetical protein